MRKNVGGASTMANSQVKEEKLTGIIMQHGFRKEIRFYVLLGGIQTQRKILITGKDILRLLRLLLLRRMEEKARPISRLRNFFCLTFSVSKKM